MDWDVDMSTVNRNVNIIAILVVLVMISQPIAAAMGAGAGVIPDQNVVVGVQGPGSAGEVVEVNGLHQNEWSRDDAASYHDITQLNDTHVLAAYAEEDELNGPHTGFRVFNTETGAVTWDWSYSVQTLPNSEVHDAEPIGDGQVLVAGMEYERVFIVNRSGEIAWQWNASEYYDAPADPTQEDWLHINDVDQIEDGRYLVSVRNEHQLLIVERGEGVVDVINEDQDTDVLNSQHNPQWLGDGHVLVADSENNRVVELEEQNGTWEPVWAVTGADGQRLHWPRDADRLENGNTLITDSRNHRVILVDENGELVEEWSTPHLPYDAELEGDREPVGGPHHHGGADGITTPSPAVESVQLVLAGLHHSIGLPAFIGWWHVVILGMLLLMKGIALSLVGLERGFRRVSAIHSDRPE